MNDADVTDVPHLRGHTRARGLRRIRMIAPPGVHDPTEVGKRVGAAHGECATIVAEIPRRDSFASLRTRGINLAIGSAVGSAPAPGDARASYSARSCKDTSSSKAALLEARRRERGERAPETRISCTSLRSAVQLVALGDAAGRAQRALQLARTRWQPAAAAAAAAAAAIALHVLVARRRKLPPSRAECGSAAPAVCWHEKASRA